MGLICVTIEQRAGSQAQGRQASATGLEQPLCRTLVRHSVYSSRATWCWAFYGALFYFIFWIIPRGRHFYCLPFQIRKLSLGNMKELAGPQSVYLPSMLNHWDLLLLWLQSEWVRASTHTLHSSVTLTGVTGDRTQRALCFEASSLPQRRIPSPVFILHVETWSYLKLFTSPGFEEGWVKIMEAKHLTARGIS